MARGIRCQAHRHTSIVAEENHHLQPQSRGGHTVAANMRYLCANAHGDVHYLLDLIEDQAAAMMGPGVASMAAVRASREHDLGAAFKMIPYATRRTFGPGVQDAALTGWLMYADAFLAGEYRRHAALWTTSGQPRPDASARLGFWPNMGVGVSVLAAPYALAVSSWHRGPAWFDAAVREAKPLP